MGLSILLADIAAVDADVVVVSANTTLDFEGGGARALAASCGPGLAAELAAVRARGAVRVGDVVATGAGVHPRLRRILWAVIRDYGGPPVDDGAAVNAAMPEVWRIVATAKRRVKVAVVPLAAVELGAATSGLLIARSLKAARLSADRVEAAIVTNRPGDVAGLEKALATVSPLPPSPSPPPSPPLPSSPPPSRPVRSRREVVGEAVVETFDRCSGAAPVGCAGVLFRVRRRDGPSLFTLTTQGCSTVEDVAVDAVPVAQHVALADGAHVLTCRMRMKDDPFFFVALLRGTQTLNTATGGKVTFQPPPSGWRQPDFDDGDWTVLARTTTPRLEMPPGVTATGTVWLRWPFTLRRTAR